MIRATDLDRLPPSDTDSEKSCIASMMLDADVRDEVLAIVDRDAWYSADHQVIFDTLKTMQERGTAIDVLTLRDELHKRQMLEEIGGVAYLGEILSSVPSGAHGAHYANIVRQKYLLRQLISASSDTIRDCYGPHTDAEELCDRAEARTLKITERRVSEKPKLLGDALMEAYEEYEDRGTRGTETGFFELDDMLNGLQAGELIIVAARPSIGKTAISLDILAHVAEARGAVLMFSLEMGRRALSQRMMCARAGVDSQRMRRGMGQADDYNRVAKAMKELSELPMYVTEDATMTPLQMRAKARLINKQAPLKLIVIDYLQLMDAPEVQENRQQQITKISRSLKSLARELNIPVIALSQLNRQSESREGHRPRISDLRESGAIEQDADVILLLHREDVYRLHEPNFIPDNIAEVIVAKQRNGPTGTVKLTFDPRATTFRNLAAQVTDFSHIPSFD